MRAALYSTVGAARSMGAGVASAVRQKRIEKKFSRTIASTGEQSVVGLKAKPRVAHCHSKRRLTEQERAIGKLFTDPCSLLRKRMLQHQTAALVLGGASAASAASAAAIQPRYR